MKKYIFLLTMFLSCMFSWGQAIDQTSAINEISIAASKIKTMQCDFVQTKSIKMLGNKLISNGRMFCEQPDKLLWEYTSPYTYIFILNGSQVLLKKGKHNDVIDVNQNKMFKEIARIMMNSILGKCLIDKKDFKTTVISNDKYYFATLIPQKKEMKQMFTKIVLHYDKNISMVVKVELHEKNGDSTLIELQNIVNNKNIDASVFKIN